MNLANLDRLRKLRALHRPAIAARPDRGDVREGRDDTRAECRALLDKHVRRYGEMFHELAA